MSFDELQSIKGQGINAIINLCGEFSDLHELEEQAGFEVMWIPVADETAPTMAEMEKGLEWLDEAVYLEKKVLVHCRYGIGRTGTFITAYLLRRGFGMKKAGKVLETASQANPTNFSQWRLLRKFGKKEGQLINGKPTPENRIGLDLSEFYKRYERIVEEAEGLSASAVVHSSGHPAVGPNSCRADFSLELIEALYLHHKVNTILTAEQRHSVLEHTEKMRKNTESHMRQIDIEEKFTCPLLANNTCMLYQYRPLHCRLPHAIENTPEIIPIKEKLSRLSQEVFLNIFGKYQDKDPPPVSIQDGISGRFIQNYFRFLIANGKKN